MLQAVTQLNDPFAGGARIPAGTPTGVGGSFGSPGTAAAPPQVPSSSIINARNNRGTNVRIPYARLVPMHGTVSRDDVKRLVTVNGKPQLEYDLLKPAELAWILGRRFKSAGTTRNPAGGVGPTDGTLNELDDRQIYAHQAYAGVGNGVDRMQRLAATPWVEALFQQKLAGAKIELHKVLLDGDYLRSVDSSFGMNQQMLAGSTLLHATDLAYDLCFAAGLTLQQIANAPTATPKGLGLGPRRRNGIFVAEPGPFLRGVQQKTDLVDVPKVEKGAEQPGHGEWVARNSMNDYLFTALEAEMRRRNLMDWTPDGLVLSKLEEADPVPSSQIDARMGQLFNVAISGPAIGTTWTSDLRDYKQECQPMDKVFIVIVADLAYNFASDNTKQKSATTQVAAVVAAIKAWNAELDAAAKANRPPDNSKNTIAAEVLKSTSAAEKVRDAQATEPDYYIKYKAFAAAAKKLEEEEAKNTSQGASVPVSLSNARTAYASAKGDLDALQQPEDEPGDSVARVNISTGATQVGQAVLFNFRLKRMTSSYMHNYSAFVKGNANSRCGLKLGQVAADGGYGEYIVGGWCIGTVMDSAASRSTVGSMTRTAPTSMALNINVCIEWWSSEKMYQHYMDKDGLVETRNRKVKDAKFKESALSKDMPLYSAAAIPDKARARLVAIGESADADAALEDGVDGGDGSAFSVEPNPKRRAV